MDTLGNRIKSLRLDKKMTQEALGKIIGVDRSSIASWETDRREPDYGIIKKLASFFDVTTDYLLGRTDINAPSTPPIEFGSKKTTAKMKKVFEAMKEFLLSEKEGSAELNIGGTLNVASIIAGGGPIYPRLELADVLGNSELTITEGGEPLDLSGRKNLIRAIKNINQTSSRAHIPLLGQIKMGIPLLAEENFDDELEIPSDIHADYALEAKGDSMIGVGLLDGDYALCREQQTAYSGDIVVVLHDITEGYSEATLKYYFNGAQGPLLRAANPNYKDIPLNSNYRIAGVLVAIIRKEVPIYKLYNNYIATRDVNKEMWDPVIERAFQLGIKPEQVIHMLETMYQIMKGTSK